MVYEAEDLCTVDLGDSAIHLLAQVTVRIRVPRISDIS